MPGTHTEPTSPVWACVDCYMLHCNGETNPEWSETETEAFLARYARGTADAEVTAGMFREHHECRGECETCGAVNAPDCFAECACECHDRELADDCECEQITFSWSPCGICGSNLGGAREALTLWVQPATV